MTERMTLKHNSTQFKKYIIQSVKQIYVLIFTWKLASFSSSEILWRGCLPAWKRRAGDAAAYEPSAYGVDLIRRPSKPLLLLCLWTLPFPHPIRFIRFPSRRGLSEWASMFWKSNVVWVISRSSFQKSSDIFVVNTNGVSIYISGVSLIIFVDSILILLFPVEFSSTEKVKALMPNSGRLSTDVETSTSIDGRVWCRDLYLKRLSMPSSVS